ncbi:DNA-binding transcriptional LysR family regulator [Mesorhizobium sp. J18]|uniref:LysR family transcriptional regulator n=1 Tax=Mesorhizobium sp. J18 TaxID=935263 RepID=UPI00119B0DF0|nr:LysR family transcriptional regulator [Mesorhizobium sp. J18]TWG99552.1 DNA-binding transcriptional LysR family regulator [Mesorhizobium sp. J18]
MIPFSIKQLETFLWVSTLGSFRKTASRLNTTQPAVSARIASLEKALGVQLFERLSNTVRLTAMGEQLLPLAQRTLRTADRLQRAADALATVNGVLRLGVAETVVHTWLSDFLKEFRESYPSTDVDLVVDATVKLRDELLAHRIDMAVLMGPVSEHRIENITIPPFPLVWVCAPHIELPDTRTSLCEMLRLPVITYAKSSRPYSELYHKLSNDLDDIPRIFPASSLAASLRMVIDGIGIGVLPQDLVEPYVEKGQLRIVDCEWRPSDLRFTVSFSMEPFNPVAEHAALLAAKVASTYARRRQSPAEEHSSDLP